MTETIDHNGFDHINNELTEAEVSEIADRHQPALVICVKSTEDNINLELLETRDEAKAGNLFELRNNLWQADDKIKAIAKKFDLYDMIGWKSV